MQRMAKSNVLVSGLGGLGIGIAKNIALAGIKSLTAHDTKVTTLADLGTQFFLGDKDVGANRAEASVQSLSELNPYVAVASSTLPLDSVESDPAAQAFLSAFTLVVLAGIPLKEAVGIDTFCRAQSPPIGVVYADVKGVFSLLFTDFGAEFEVIDSTGEEYRRSRQHSTSPSLRKGFRS